MSTTLTRQPSTGNARGRKRVFRHTRQRKDHTVPGTRWAFDANVTQAFDDMLRRSIPQYDEMRQACGDLAVAFARPGTEVLDLGCSRGGAIQDLLPLLPACVFTGLEISAPMLQACRAKFSREIDGGKVRIIQWDLRKELPPARASVVLSVLTLQFVPIEYRQAVVSAAAGALADGGAFILVEKVLGGSAEVNAEMVRLYHTRKMTQGYSPGDVERKRLSLEGVLVPITADWNEQMLRRAGFAQVDCFWRWMNFAGWIALK